MATVIGIDTGGTFTDGVVVDLATKKIISAVKSPTTHHDLMIGIRETIHKLDLADLKASSYLAISTTLATNAIVENRGCRVGLLLLGHEDDKELPDCEYCSLPGKINIRGEETEPLDFAKTKAAILNLKDKVDAVAVSGICSVRNLEHEEVVKKMVRDLLGVPVVAAHELSTALGIHERTVTCVLNARLVYVIDNLLCAVKQVLKELGIDIPLMVVKGDGSLMNETITRERPIETILSGPAASIIGATYLNGSADGLVLDMGGTTTDIAILKDGLPRLDREGAKVGGWRTRVEAVEVTTSGMGGDSRISVDKDGMMHIGPRRNWPVSVISDRYPHYLVELQSEKYHHTGLFHYAPYEGFFLLHQPPVHMELTEQQKKIIAAVADGPHTIAEIGRRINEDPNLINLGRLLDYAILGPVGFTPTDILCIEGSYDAGSKEAAQIAASMLANKMNLKVAEFIEVAKEGIKHRVSRAVLDSAMTYEKINIDAFSDDDILDFFFHSAVRTKPKTMIFRNRFQLKLPIIGIGAPTKFWLPPAAEAFDTEAVFPEYNHVANAVGAAVGKVMSITRIVVQNHDTEGISIFAPWGKYSLNAAVNQEDNVMERAIEMAIEQGKKHIAEDMKRQNITDYEILIDRKDTGISGKGGLSLPIETNLQISAVGKMDSLLVKPKQKSLLGNFWGKDKTPDYSQIPSVT